MRVSITKGDGKADLVTVSVSDGPLRRVEVPKKGRVPHDAVHWVVEHELGIRGGFWGYVKDGARFTDIAEIAKAGGHASSTRAQPASEEIFELLQAERLVECFEAELWSSPSDASTFRDVLRVACLGSFVPPPALTDADLRRIRERLSRLIDRWDALKAGQDLVLDDAAPSS